MNDFSPSRDTFERPLDAIEMKTCNEIDVYLSARGKSHIHEDARGLSLNISDDYGNRFLVELIQNAHDAHPADDQNGEIAVVFVPEGDTEFGCLYVANRGNGFSNRNFLAVTNIARSSKPVNEGIGNKGLGFRSVLQICQWPEIYSTNTPHPDGAFDGYSFRFATVDDVAQRLPHGYPREVAGEILRNMPYWFLPVPATERPGLVQRFAQEGFATVLRMPLMSDTARKLVFEQIDALLNQAHPLHLFLTRIASIRIERRPGEVAVLERRVISQRALGRTSTLSHVHIGPDHFVIGERELDDEAFRAELEATLADGKIPKSWRDWQGAAKVSVAVRIGKPVSDGVLYCFLPLGNAARSPLAGYVSANFYTKMDRLRVDESIRLNGYFLKCAAQLSVQILVALIDEQHHQAESAVVDLLCWNPPYAANVRGAVEAECEQALLDCTILPTLGDGGKTQWSSPRNTFIWEAPASACFAPADVARIADARLLHTGLNEQQRQAVREFFASNKNFAPGSKIKANWAQSIAHELLRSAATGSRWADFYDEIAEHLKDDPAALFGKKFLLNAQKELIAPESEHPSRQGRTQDIFFPPASKGARDTEDETAGPLPIDDFPVALSGSFAFLSALVQWTQEGGRHRRARNFLLDGRLVREYDTRNAIRALARITAQDTADGTRMLALEWAARLWLNSRVSDKDTRTANLHVRTRGGWMTAEAAMFGEGWSGCPNGKKLERFLEDTRAASKEFADARSCLLPSYSAWPIEFGTEADWTEFLQKAGVRDSLRPAFGRARLQLDGHNADQLARDMPYKAKALPRSAIQSWQKNLIVASAKAQYSTVAYRADCHEWRLPGQCGVSWAEPSMAVHYAVQVVLAIRELGDEHLHFRVYRPGNPTYGQNAQSWPTPLLALLRDSAWMPVGRPDGEIRLVKPADAWHFNEEGASPPRFIDLLVQPVARLMDEVTLEKSRKLIGLRTLNDERDAVPALTALAAVSRTGLTDARDCRRFRELFGAAWDVSVECDDDIALDCVPVLAGETIRALDVTAGEDCVAYFIDQPDRAKERVLEELGLPVFNFGSENTAETRRWLDALAPGRFRSVSGERLEVFIDGEPFGPQTHAPCLVHILGSWIGDFVACVAEFKGGPFFQSTQSKLTNVLRRTMLLRVRTATRIEIHMVGGSRPLPAQGAVKLERDDGAVLILDSEGRALTLSMLANVAEHLAAALGYPILASPLEAAFLKLAASQDRFGDEGPDDGTIAQALNVSVNKIMQTKRHIRDETRIDVRLTRLLASSVGCLDVAQALDRLLESQACSNDALRRIVLPLAENRSLAVDELLNRLSAVLQPRDLMIEFNVPLRELNAAIRQSEDFKLVSNQSVHERQMSAWLNEHRDTLIDIVRARYLADFDSHVALDAYVRLRNQIPQIEPDNEWFFDIDELTDDAMSARAQTWLESQGVPVAEADGAVLVQLSEVRQENARRLRDFWRRFGSILAVWTRLHRAKISAGMLEAWTDTTSATQQRVAARASEEGWMDFRLLSDETIAARLTACGVWPEGQAANPELNAWGIDDRALAERKAQAHREREHAREERRRIKVDGVKFSTNPDSYHELMDAITAGFTGSQAFDASSFNAADVNDVERRKPSGSSGGKGSSAASRSDDTAMSDEQRLAVGLIGEVYAREWIRRFHRKQHKMEVPDHCWVSEYRNGLMGEAVGQDKFGYDFKVERGRKSYYYEVKASQGDPGSFQFGPTEIVAADRYREDEDHIYRILYVSHVTEGSKTRIRLLPNPFSVEGMRKLHPVGRGAVTYAFDLSSRDVADH
ncbi:sacsin N-terminal ATP-binding-like domain-containing protein [Caballeronia glebae]|uniref:sacsin N-terminal ATP-binding-like domain-containing protein n=1 Tax=Caballeronia glebae TaxID=1777143 RepID=UPI0038BD0879